MAFAAHLAQFFASAIFERGLTRWAFRQNATPAWAHNSAVECHLHTVEVVGSNPAVPTNPFNNLDGTAERHQPNHGEAN